MSFLQINNVSMVGLAACVPPDIEENATLPIFEKPSDAANVIASTGIARKRIVRQGTTASDLCVPAVIKLLEELKWGVTTVDCLVYICQTRDFLAPITSAILQDRLGLRNDCYCIDMPLGCSGWIYGMSNIASLLSHGGFKRGLLICGETNSKNRSPFDKTVKPLFGDAATVTALEFNSNAEPMFFEFGVDGKGYQAVWTEYGGSRNPVTKESIEMKEIESGVVRRGIDMIVNGMDVFSFAIKVPPRSLQNIIEHYNIDTEKVDFLWLHQANKYIDERIRKKINMPAEKVKYCLEDFGNTSCASIPLTIVTRGKDELNGKKMHLACGFGVGLAWGSMYFSTENVKIVELLEYQYQ